MPGPADSARTTQSAPRGERLEGRLARPSSSPIQSSSPRLPPPRFPSAAAAPAGPRRRRFRLPRRSAQRRVRCSVRRDGFWACAARARSPAAALCCSLPLASGAPPAAPRARALAASRATTVRWRARRRASATRAAAMPAAASAGQPLPCTHHSHRVSGSGVPGPCRCSVQVWCLDC